MLLIVYSSGNHQNRPNARYEYQTCEKEVENAPARSEQALCGLGQLCTSWTVLAGTISSRKERETEDNV